jgi:hypothetical protein
VSKYFLKIYGKLNVKREILGFGNLILEISN